MNKLVAKKQGAPHSTHVKSNQSRASHTQPWGTDLHSWEPPGGPGDSQNSSIISMDNHVQYTTAQPMWRDHPSQSHSTASSRDDIVSIHDLLSDVDMESNNGQPEQHTEDSSPDSGSDGSNHCSGDSDMESNQDWGSGHNSDSSSDHNSHPGLDWTVDWDPILTPVTTMKEVTSLICYTRKGSGSVNPPKKPESCGQSSSCSRSWEMESQK